MKPIKYHSCRIMGCTFPVIAHFHCRNHIQDFLNARALLPKKKQLVSKLRPSKAPKGPCKVEGCIKLSFNRDLCSAHYMQLYRHGRILSVTIGTLRAKQTPPSFTS